MRYLRKIKKRGLSFLNLAYKNVRNFYWTVFMLHKGVEVGKNIILKGKPKIYKFSGNIKIGDNVTILSNDFRYHSSLYKPTRLMTDTNPNAAIEIGDNSRINGVSIHATKKISIGKNCLIAANVTILDSDGHGTGIDERAFVNPVSLPVIIEDNVWIGINSIILKGVKIGENSVVGAGSVVSNNVPPNSIVAGNPAKVVKTLTINKISC